MSTPSTAVTSNACFICNVVISSWTDVDITTHVTNSHKPASYPATVVDATGTSHTVVDADALTALIKAHPVTISAQQAPTAPVPGSRMSFAQRCGLMMADVKKAKIRVTGSGRMLSDMDVQRLFESVDELAGYKTDHNNVFSAMVVLCVGVDFTSETEDYGSFIAEPSSAVAAGTAAVSVHMPQVLEAWTKKMLDAKAPAPTWRRFGSSFGNEIWDMVQDRNSALGQFYVSGHPVANRYAADRSVWYAVLSIFPFMKEPASWTPAEAALARAHVEDVVKDEQQAGGRGSGSLQALRPDPNNTFSARMQARATSARAAASGPSGGGFAPKTLNLASKYGLGYTPPTP